MQQILTTLVKKTINCGCRDWQVFYKDKVALRQPTGRYTHGHSCPKMDVYRTYMSLDRVYVVKGDLADKILKNAPIKKKQESEVEEAQQHNTQQEAKVEPQS